MTYLSLTRGADGAGARALARRVLALRIGRLGAAEFVALVAAGLFMAVIGAFDTNAAPWGARLTYWIAVITGGGVAGAATEVLVRRWAWTQARPLARAVVTVILMGAPITALVQGVSWAVFRGDIALSDWAMLYPRVVVVGAALAAIAALIERARVGAISKPPAVEDGAPTGLRERLQPRLARARLHALKAEDHYVRVFTSAGEALVLMKFADALDAVAQRAGHRTHRSWWVAAEAVERLNWRRGRGVLVLANAVEAPVSRSYLAALKKADWA
jgi:hypothetical protein